MSEFKTVRMEMKHLDETYEIEKNSFSIPWTRKSFEEEITANKMGIYYVAVEENAGVQKVVGYGGMWHVITEGHITNVAVAEEYRGRGIGDLLIDALEKEAVDKEMIGLTLEVRVGNTKAMKLYAKHGFKVEGIRKNYYADTKEDAIVMWKYFN